MFRGRQIVFLVSLVGCAQLLVTDNNEVTTEISGYVFGELRNFTAAPSTVFHIEVDTTNSSWLLFSVRGGIMATDGHVTSVVVGSDSEFGYAEGSGTQARFYYSKGFAQLFKRLLLIVDERNHCLRLVERDSLQTSPFAGVCQSSGFEDGAPGLLYHPQTMLRDVHSDGVYVADSSNDAIRYVDLITRYASTVISAGVRSPASLTFDFDKGSLLISNYHYISRYDLASRTLTNITGTPHRARLVDGNLTAARFFYPKELLSLSENVTLIADANSNAVRVVDEGESAVSSICTGRRGYAEGPAGACELLYPASLLLADDVLYVGSDYGISTISVHGSSNQPTPTPSPACPENVSLSLDSSDQTAAVVWLLQNTSGYVSRTEYLGLGDYEYRLPAHGHGDECQFTLSVQANSSDQVKCPEQSIEVKLLPDQTNTTVEVVPGVFLTLSEGSYLFEIPRSNCSVYVNVNQRSDQQCSGRRIMAVADSLTNTAVVSLGDGEIVSSITLPVGVYEYTYRLGLKNCSTFIDVYDPRVRRRLAFKADYSIKCSELADGQVRSVLILGAKHKYLQIEEMCAGKCKRSPEADVVLACVNDVTSLTWPTDQLFGATQEKVPDYITSAVEPKLRMQTLLDVILFTHTPPVVFPIPNDAGQAATLVLEETCEDGFSFNSTDNRCSASVTSGPF